MKSRLVIIECAGYINTDVEEQKFLSLRLCKNSPKPKILKSSPLSKSRQILLTQTGHPPIGTGNGFALAVL